MVENAGHTHHWAKVPRFPDLAILDESTPSLNVLPEGGHPLILAHCKRNLREDSCDCPSSMYHCLCLAIGVSRNWSFGRFFPERNCELRTEQIGKFGDNDCLLLQPSIQ
jgi:hypothetical protein